MSDHEIEQPTFSNYTLSILGALGSLLLFLFILFIAYLPNRPEPVDAKIVEQRTALLASVKAEQKELATSVEWIDQEKGIARIPIGYAKKIIVNRLNEK